MDRREFISTPGEACATTGWQIPCLAPPASSSSSGGDAAGDPGGRDAMAAGNLRAPGSTGATVSSETRQQIVLRGIFRGYDVVPTRNFAAFRGSWGALNWRVRNPCYSRTMINQKSVVTAQRLEATSFSRDLVTVDVREDLYRLSSLVRAEIQKVRLEPELSEASPTANAVPAGN